MSCYFRKDVGVIRKGGKTDQRVWSFSFPGESDDDKNDIEMSDKMIEF